MIKLYGCRNGYGSRAQVTRGFVRAMKQSNLEFYVHAVDQDDGSFERTADGAAIAIMTGPIESSSQVAMTHKRRMAMVAPNGTAIPNAMKKLLKEVYTDILVPSDWCVQAVEDIGLPVHVVPHGVFDSVREANHPRKDLSKALDRFSVIHFSSSHGQRKGTVELIRAWQLLRARHADWSHAFLVLVLDERAQVRILQDYDGPLDGVTVTSRLDGPYYHSGQPPLQFANGLRLFHTVCQPSRGEAFGLVPLEAMAAGVPVVLTAATGHQQYCYSANCIQSEVLVMPTGDMAPLDDCEGSMAPVVRVEAIADGLYAARSHWGKLNAEAEDHRVQVAEDWSWNVHTGNFLRGIYE